MTDKGTSSHLPRRSLQRLLQNVAALHMGAAENVHEGLGGGAHTC